MKSRLIRKLGGITLAEHESELSKLKDDCEQFVDDFLISRREQEWVLRGGSVRHGQHYPDKALTIIGSNTSVYGATVSSCHIAPWARNVLLSGLVTPTTGEDDE